MDGLWEATKYFERTQQPREVMKRAIHRAIAELDKEYLVLLEQLQEAQAKAERLENAIKETLETLKRGGPGTRSQVQALLEKALEGKENE